VLTLPATVLAIIAPCSPTEDHAHNPCQWPNWGQNDAGARREVAHLGRSGLSGTVNAVA